YSLIELSLVIAILGVILASGMNVVGRKQSADRLRTTQERMERIVDAIQEFADINRFIPCPASPSAVAGGATYGVSSTYTSPNCATSNGSVPVRALNLSDDYMYDGWDRRFTY